MIKEAYSPDTGPRVESGHLATTSATKYFTSASVNAPY